MAKIAALAPLVAGGAGMSTPLLVASGLASALGGLMESRAQSQASDKRNDAFAQVDADMRRRDDEMRLKSKGALDQLVQQHTQQAREPVQQQVQERILSAAQPEGVAPTIALPGQDRAGSTVQTHAAKTLSDAANETRKRLAALAKLTAFDVGGSQLGATRAAGATDAGILANLRAGNMRVGADQKSLHQGAYENRAPSFGAQLLKGAGQLGMTAAGRMSGGGTPLPYSPYDGAL